MVADMNTNPPALVARSLEKSFGPVRALSGVDLVARRGEVTAVLGPNGAGKTTTISCATGLLHPDAGEVRVLDQDPWRAGPELRARVGVMIQDGGLTSGATALGLLRYGAALYADPLDVDQVAEHLGITEFGSTLVRRLSGGQRQRLALSLAIIGRPELVFLDEPTAGMDPSIRRTVRHLIRSLARTGTAVVLTTHMMDDVEGLADHVAVVAQGRTVAQGTVDEVVAAHRVPGDTVTLTATAHGLSGQEVTALSQELQDVAARHELQLDIRTGGAVDLESVLVDLGRTDTGGGTR
jgi:ABC-2 type transport system ATP-binding protein